MTHLISSCIHMLKQCLIFHKVGCYSTVSCYVAEGLPIIPAIQYLQPSHIPAHMTLASCIPLPLLRPKEGILETFYHFKTLQLPGLGLCSAVLNPVSHAAAAKSLQSSPTLCDPIDGSPPGSAVPGILQARTLEWVAISFSNA